MKTKDTESEILKAAEQEFMLKGFDGAKTTSIAHAAGVTHAMLPLLFQNEGTVVRAYSYRKSTIDERVGSGCFRSTGIASLGAAERRSYLSFCFIAANPQLPRFIVNEVFSRPERYKLMSDKIVKVADCLMKGIQQELDELHAQGKVEWVDVRMLLLDIISLNVFPFIAYPIIEPILGDIAADRNRFFELRKAENIEMIMRRIKK